MPGSLLGMRYRNLLLGGSITSAQLQTELEDTARLGAFKAMLAYPQARYLFNDATAAEIMYETHAVLAAVINNGDILRRVQNTLFWNETLLTINAPGSLLKFTTFNSSGTWTPSVNGTDALQVLAQAPGGNGGAGATGTGVNSGGGGGGGELAGLIVLLGDIPVSPVTVTIGAVGANTSFGSLLIANFGGNGATGVEGVGGGSTTNGGAIKNLPSTNPSTGVGIFGSFRQKGGDGGDGVAPLTNGINGQSVSPIGTGGTGGTSGVNATAGSGFAAGGGSGYNANGASSGAGGAAPSAAANSGCGAAGGMARSGGQTGGAGGSGAAWVLELQRPAP